MPQGSRFLLPGPFLIRTSWRRSLKKQITGMRYDETPSLRSCEEGTFSGKKRKQIHCKKRGKTCISCKDTRFAVNLCRSFVQQENRDFYSLSKPLCQHFFSATVSKMFFSPVVEKPPWLWLESRNPSYSLFCSFPIAEGEKRHWKGIELTYFWPHLRVITLFSFSILALLIQ